MVSDAAREYADADEPGDGLSTRTMVTSVRSEGGWAWVTRAQIVRLKPAGPNRFTADRSGPLRRSPRVMREEPRDKGDLLGGRCGGRSARPTEILIARHPRFTADQ